ncbi:hypothetical protein SRHO_G00254280 [Serrasalmus rhombeus]
MFYLTAVLLLAGDIQLNPGPRSVAGGETVSSSGVTGFGSISALSACACGIDGGAADCACRGRMLPSVVDVPDSISVRVVPVAARENSCGERRGSPGVGESQALGVLSNLAAPQWCEMVCSKATFSYCRVDTDAEGHQCGPTHMEATLQ